MLAVRENVLRLYVQVVHVLPVHLLQRLEDGKHLQEDLSRLVQRNDLLLREQAVRYLAELHELEYHENSFLAVEDVVLRAL